MKLFPVLMIATFSVQSLATLTPSYPRGEEIISHEVGGGRAPEICIIPKKLPGAAYSKSDLENEKELCGFHIGVNAAACGKENSTNPGVNFFTPEVPKNTPANVIQQMVTQLQQSDCTAKNAQGEEADKDAKYKLSTSCSYSPSLLAYYHMSRALGNIVNVPPAVLRTMDLGRHIAIGEKSLKDTEGKGLINDTWRSLMTQLRAGRNSNKKDLLFTDDFTQSYGALQKNPKKEERYQPEFFNGGTDRVAAFRDSNSIYRSLRTANLTVPRTFNKENVQKMVQLRDAADFILLDTILGQQDRFGNIHYIKKYFYTRTNAAGQFDVKSEKKLEKIPEALRASAVEVKEMLLKDNDCGVAKENRIAAAGLLNNVAHMSPKTYKALLALERIIDQADVREQFITGYMFTQKDFETVSGNLKRAASMLKTKCLSGALKLDLSLDDHFSGQALPASQQCEI
ncbi:MAG: hypothetical protein ACK5WZ_01805 [Pseudobdellovibrionaceae bacterium]